LEVEIRPATAQDAIDLAQGLRPADIAELHACGHSDLDEVVARSVRVSSMCWAAFVDGQIACVIGVAPLSLLGGLGAPWMLGTPVLDKASRVLVRRTPEYISKMLGAFPHLLNYVHADNGTSVRWLKRLGFVFGEPFAHPRSGETFYPFEMRA